MATTKDGVLFLDGGDFKNAMAELKKVAPDMHKVFLTGLRKQLGYIKAEQQAMALTVDHAPSEIKRQMAGAVAYEVRQTSSRKTFLGVRTRMRSSKLSGGPEWPNNAAVMRMGQRINRGFWRHPVFQRTSVGAAFGQLLKGKKVTGAVDGAWVKQETDPGWFDQPFRNKQDALVLWVEYQYQGWARKFGQKFTR